MNLLALDARWQRLNDPDYACPCCGRSFGGLVDIGFDAPDVWPFAVPGPGDVVTEGDDKLSSELCRLGDARFLRAHLAIPLRGAEDAVHLAPWLAVSPPDFYAVLDRIEAGDGTAARFPATLANALPPLLETGAAGVMHAGPAEARPDFRPADGALVAAVTDGLSFDAVLDLYAAIGADIRPHLTGRR
ncbi:DUF2199 domain-containing protein [Roseivivax sp. CAU 1753]